jgi:hypothetical protein
VAPYVPRAAADTVLHGLVHEHLETFLATAAARTDGMGLPHFIEREFRAFLRCGVLVHGFARVCCDECAFERLVPFSCKTRAVCPSCGGWRMAERAAHLVETVLPTVPVRQWVLAHRDDRVTLEPNGSLVTHANLSGLSEKGHPWNEIVVDGRGNAYVNNQGFDFPGGEFAPGTIALLTRDGSARRVADGNRIPERYGRGAR